MTLRRALLACAALSAFALRVGGLGDLGELEYDEAFSWALGSRGPSEVLEYLLTDAYDPHPPVFYWLIHWWMAAVGESEPALRMVAVLPSALAAPLVGSSVAIVAGTRAGVVAAWALALAPMDIFYSRYARMYGLASLLMTVLIAAAAWNARSQARASALRGTVGLVGVLGLATHYYTGFGLLGAAAGLGTSRIGTRFMLGALAACAALGIGWLAVARGPRTNVLTPITAPPADPTILGSVFLQSFGAIAFPFGPTLYAAGLIVLAGGLVIWQWRSLPAALAATALGGFIIPTLAVPALGLLGRPFAARYVLVTIPFAAVLVGLAASRLPRPILALAALIVVPAAVVALRPSYGYDCCDYEEAMEALRVEVRADDAVALHSWPQEILYHRYAADLPTGVNLSPRGRFVSQEAMETLAALSRAHARLWLIEAAPGYVDPSGLVLRWLDTNLYPVSQQRFRNALLRLYLTDAGRPTAEGYRVDAQLLDVDVESVALDSRGGRIAPGAESRIFVRAQDRQESSRVKLSARLLAPDGSNVWQQDRLFISLGGRLIYRAGMAIPANAAPGRYTLQLVVYEEGPPGGAPIARTSDPRTVADIEIGISLTPLLG